MSQDLSNYRQHLEGVHGGAVFKCKICSKEFKWQRSLRRHMVLNHSFGVSGGGFDGFDIGNAKSFTHNGAVNMVAPSHISNISSNMDGKFDIRLKENFKMFVSGPSRCGKTVFVSKLLENIHAFAKIPPVKVLYIYKVWQPKYDEIVSLGVNFMEDSDNIVNDIKSSVSGQPMLVIFDDLIGSSSLKGIADLFTVDARHMNMSLVFLTQRMFVNEETFKQISQNCDYFSLSKTLKILLR